MATLRVSNQAQLNEAVLDARGGDTILLEAGTYGELEMSTSKGNQGHVNFGSKVTIASADPGRPAVINELLLRGAGNIEFKNVKFDYTPGKSGEAPFVIQNTRNVTLDNVDLDGHVAGGYGSGIGLRVAGSQNFSLVNSEVSNFRNGLSFTSSADVTISGNDFRGISNDAMLLGGLKGVLISGNDFRAMNSKPSQKHKDMIQFFNSSEEAPSSDIVIRNNVIENPEETHSIFFGNTLADRGNMSAYFRDILIEDNYIRAAHLHGITIDHGSNVTIRNNTLVHNTDEGNRDMVNIPLINVSSQSTNVDIVGNRAAGVPEDRSSSWTVSGNVTGGKNVVQWNGDYGSGGGSGDGDAQTDLPDGASGGGSGGGIAPDPDPETGSEGGSGTGTGSGTGGETIGGGGGQVRINGNVADGAARQVEGIDFSGPDTIVFNNFDRGTFQTERGDNSIHVWSDGGAVKVDSALDLQEIVQSSPDIAAAQAGDDLVLRIAQDGDDAEIVFAGLAAAFRAADQPDLF